MGLAGDQDEQVGLCLVSSLLTKSLLHPLDTLKTRVQVSNTRAFHAFIQNWAGQWHVLALFRGLGTKLILYAPYQLTYLAAFVSVNNFLQASTDALPACLSESQKIVLTTFLATGVAEIASSPIRILLEVSKSRLQVGMDGVLRTALAGAAQQLPNSQQLNFRQRLSMAIRAMLQYLRSNRKSIIKSFPTYFTAQILLHDFPFSCIQWSTYKLLKAGADNRTEYQPETSQLWKSMQTGLLSGALATVATQPSDVIRCCAFTQRGGASVRVRDTVKRLWLEGGVLRFFFGLPVRSVWIISNSVLFFTVLDQMKLMRRSYAVN